LWKLNEVIIIFSPYLLGILNVKFFEIYDGIRGQDKANLHEDRVATDFGRQGAGRAKSLEFRLPIAVSKL
jgi:hypothetical protein